MLRRAFLLLVCALGGSACTSLLGNDFTVDGAADATGGAGNETGVGGAPAGGMPSAAGGASASGGASVQVACATPCGNAHGKAECSTGACVLTCDPGFGDCDGDKGNGCETDVDKDPVHCGSCTNVCVAKNAAAACGRGECTLGVCLTGYGDCDKDVANGCELQLNSVNDCGGCGVACTNGHGATACTNSACAPTCDTDWGDCDGDKINGCETSLAANPLHCGVCGKACLADELCQAGSCVKAALCGEVFKKDCDGGGLGDDANGCETNIAADSSNCGACGMVCTVKQLCLGACTACPGGTLDCNKGTDGCEVLENPLQCGACGQACGTDGTCGCGSGICSGGTIYLSEDFSDNSRGWSLEGEWEIGATAVSPPLLEEWENGNPDPAMDHSLSADNGIAALGLGKNYEYMRVHGMEYLTSPVIALPNAPASMNLTFWSWLNADGRKWTNMTVEVKNGAGVWVKKWGNTAYQADTAWDRIQIDVAAESNPSFQVRFGFSVEIANNLYPWLMSGWNIDDVTVSETTCL
ncbi:MAG: hypothetical protein SFV15_19880 [Polyangiaceae bacterium]|nr:hypothetical protein [Polyangiaceae bacterium]